MTLERRSDQMAVSMARLMRGHGLVLQGIGTPLAMAAIVVAKVVYEPAMQIVYTVGNVLSEALGPVRLCSAEWGTIPNSLQHIRMSELIWQSAPSLRGFEFLRPAQIDVNADTNSVVIGSYRTPTVRLAGPAGIPDALVFNPNLVFYVPNHSRSTLVNELDFRSGRGRRFEGSGAHALQGERSYYLVTDRAVLKLEGGSAVFVSVHPGEDVEAVRQDSGFPISGDPPPSDPPTEAEVAALRQYDPLRIRDLELLGGRRRRQRLRRLVDEEATAFKEPGTWRRSESGAWQLAPA